MTNETLSTRIFRPEGEVKAAMFVVHGMEEHKERYEDFARYMNSRGIAVVTYDLPGHGETSPKSDYGFFGERDGWHILSSTLTAMSLLTRDEFPGVPLICYGHSMGTMLARTFIQYHDALIQGLMLSGAPNYNPGARLGKALASMKVKRSGARSHSRLLDTLATGAFNSGIKKPRTKLDWLSYNEENVDAYIADEACGFPFTARGYYDLFEGMEKMADPKNFHCTNPYLPIMFLSGEDDPCTGGAKGLADSIRRMEEAGYRSITSKVYPGMRHEILQEKDHQKVYEDMAEWILNMVVKEYA
ncbi:MAG: alpha/beta hydrolase [Erysipelotrichaceae bacterium]|nr:alpha/beta hydrolase [Erysipelotrichaceae bacterium]